MLSDFDLKKLRRLFQEIASSASAIANAIIDWSNISNKPTEFPPEDHDHDDIYLNKENTDAFTPDADYQPATKKYVDDNSSGVPLGGTSGQVLTKLSDDDGDADWVTLMSAYHTDEVDDYIDGLTTPLSGTQISRLREFVLAIKEALHTNDLSTRFDFFYLFANETQEAALRNLIKRSHDATNVHSTAWAQWEGFTGDGANDYLDTNYNASTHANAYKLNNSSAGVYLRTVSSQAGWVMGGGDGSSSTADITGRWTDNFHYLRLGTDTGNTRIAKGNNNPGVFSGSRYASNQQTNFIHDTAGDQAVSFTQVSESIPNVNTFILARNVSGSAGSFSSNQIAIAWIGESLTRREEDIIHYILESYMDSIGKGVLSY